MPQSEEPRQRRSVTHMLRRAAHGLHDELDFDGAGPFEGKSSL